MSSFFGFLTPFKTNTLNYQTILILDFEIGEFNKGIVNYHVLDLMYLFNEKILLLFNESDLVSLLVLLL